MKPDDKNSVGAYAFTLPDYNELDYPLDLWLEWTTKIFDEVSIVTYGHLALPSYPNLIVTEVDPISRSSFEFYTIGKSVAQEKLTTDWKVLLDIDEFLPTKLDVSKLNKMRTYAFKMHHLYGNVHTEILGAFPEFYYRIHYGNRRVLGDGGAVFGPYAGKIIYRRALRYALWRYLKIGTHVSPLNPFDSFPIYHTGACRRPDVMSRKWKVQTELEIKEGIKDNEERLSLLDTAFDYHKFQGISKNASLRPVGENELPVVLAIQSQRFNQVVFDDWEYY